MKPDGGPGSASGRGSRIAIIGAGPIGLEAAARAARGGFDFHVFEMADIAAHVRSWGHVTLFTPFGMNHSRAGADLLAAELPRHPLPDDGELLTGQAFADRYLVPLTQTDSLGDRIHVRHRVVGVGRSGFRKREGIGDPERAAHPFDLLIEGPDGKEYKTQADVVIDASGTLGQPNSLGDGGIPAIGEKDCDAYVSYHLDDISGQHRNRYAGRRTILVGSGYSSATAIVALRRLVEEVPGTHVTWLLRSRRDRPILGIVNDRLPARRELARLANDIASGSHPSICVIRGVVVERLERRSDCIVLHAKGRDGNETAIMADRVIANIGYRPDRLIYRELQIHECYATFAPMKIATELMSVGVLDCLDQRPTSDGAIINPEPNFFILGAKSYGLDSTFLMQTGIEQVQQVFCLLENLLRESV